MSSEKHCVRCGAGSASRRGNICMACGDIRDAVREFVQMVPAIDTAEAPPPYALTAAQLPGLERAIRAEGYAVLLDTESGEVVLMKPTEDKRLRAPVGRMEQALRAILSRIQFGGEPYPGLIEQLCKEGLGADAGDLPVLTEPQADR